MAGYFFDSSALVKRYRMEAGTGRVSELLDGAAEVHVARLAHVEVASALIRRARTTGVADEDLDRAIAVLSQDVAQSFNVIEIDATATQRAIALTRRHALRAADALQLACALLARDLATSGEFFLVGSDQELNLAGRAEGLAVIDPTRPA